MEAALKVRGGARIGLVNATWPLARLSISRSELKLSCLQGIYEFSSSDVVALEPYGSIPLFSTGIRIVHARADYPAKIIFWYFFRNTLIGQISEAGFLPSAPASSEVRWRGMPVRWTALVLFVITWNALCLLTMDFAKPSVALALIPLLSATTVCWGIRNYPDVQRMVIRDGRSVNEIKAYLSLIQIVCGLLSIAFGIAAVIQLFQ